VGRASCAADSSSRKEAASSAAPAAIPTAHERDCPAGRTLPRAGRRYHDGQEEAR
jgi:hypothetical protein